MKHLFAITLFALCIGAMPCKGLAQLSDYIYAVSVDSTNIPYFAKIKIGTDSVFNLQPCNGLYNSSYSSACVDKSAGIFYICTGSTLAAFDANVDSITKITNLPFSLSEIRFNPCDSSIYGLKDLQSNPGFCRYNPYTDSLYDIPTLAPFGGSCGGCIPVLNIEDSTFTYQTMVNFNPNILVTINISTGDFVQTMPINLPNEQFGHIGLGCYQNKIYGTSVGNGGKYMATLELSSGLIAHVTDNNWTEGIFKYEAGNCIDQTDGIYFYNGAGSNILNGFTNTLIGVEINTGTVLYYDTLNNGSGRLALMEHFSDCGCQKGGSETGIAERNIAPRVYPQPCTNKLTVEMPDDENYSITIYDLLLHQILQQEFKYSLNINTTRLEPGVYFYAVRNTYGSVKTGKLIKQ